MKYALCLLALLVGTASAESANPQYGPAASPISWTEMTAPGKSAEFSPRREVLRGGERPVWVRRVKFKDQRPYGEKEDRTVWLARYEALAIEAPDDSNPAIIRGLNLAFDTTTNELLCAFTDAAPQWVQTTVPNPEDVMNLQEAANDMWTVSPAHYDNLHSTLPEVLAAFWKIRGIDPSKAGQVIVRPRFVSQRFQPYYEATGQPVVDYLPSNRWIVEVLGTAVMSKRFEGEKRVYTTAVGLFRDGDLKYLGGSINP